MGPTHPTFTVVYETIHAHTVSRMSVPPTLQDLADTAHALNPEVVARFDAVRVRMPYIAEAVNAFNNPTLQERAFYELVSIINPGEPEANEVPANVRADHDLGMLANWLHFHFPAEMRGVDGTPNRTVADAAIGLIRKLAPLPVDQGLRREPGQVDDREQAGQ